MTEKFRHIPITGIAVIVLWLMLTACARFGQTISPGRSLQLQRGDITVAEGADAAQHPASALSRHPGFPLLEPSTVAASNIGGSANLGYTERPTITYTPLTGSEFARRIFSPIPAELMFGASQGGYATDLLMISTGFESSAEC
jgi:hypothetical protein